MEQKIIDLIRKLITKTNNKQAIWKITSRSSEFSLDLPSGKITIDQLSWFDNLGSPFYSADFKIYNENGEEIYSSLYSKHENPDEYNLLDELHKTAKSSYYKVDEIVDSFIKKLDSKDFVGGDDDMPF
jgi:hypothetical protein